MENNMNLLEQGIISEIAITNDQEYPFINNHIPYLKVKSRCKRPTVRAS